MSELITNILPEIPSGAELEEERDSRFLPQDEWEEVDISGDWLDVTEAYQRPRWTLAYDGVPLAPLGGIHGMNGLPGNGKTMMYTIIMAAILKGKYGRLTYELKDIPNPRVLYIDTEMEKGNTQLVNLRIYSMMGWSFGVPHDEFRVIMLRETERAVDRWRKILKAIDSVRPNVCFIDGMLDVVSDFNNNEECQEIVYKCMKTASHYNMSLWGLVHLNPGGAKSVGHMGSIFDRKETDGLKVSKHKDAETGEVYFTVEQTKARGKDLPDWKFVIKDDINGFGIPVFKEDKPVDESKTMYHSLQTMMAGLTLSTRDMRSKVMDGLRLSHEDAMAYINKAVDEGILLVNEEWTKDHTKLKSRHYTFNSNMDVPF